MFCIFCIFWIFCMFCIFCIFYIFCIFCMFCIFCIFCIFFMFCIFCIFWIFCTFCIFCIFCIFFILYVFCILFLFCTFCIFCMFCIFCIFWNYTYIRKLCACISYCSAIISPCIYATILVITKFQFNFPKMRGGEFFQKFIRFGGRTLSLADCPEKKGISKNEKSIKTIPFEHFQKPKSQETNALQLDFKLQHFPVWQLAGLDQSGNFPDRIDLKHNLSWSDGQTSCLLSDRP